MASQGVSRKRPAPGADPIPFPPQMPNPTPAYNDGLGQNLSNDEFFQWGQTGQTVPAYNDNNFALNANTYPHVNAQPSTQLTRRPMTQLAAPLRTRMSEDGSAWIDPTNGAQSMDSAWEDDISALEARAQVAKRDSQAKRKQIPPFVQKLNSFLEDGKNTELIRWSDDGNSFIVLDEDEFAKTLIPELFKHNNYASFVRQLNMYGFHKKVGLSDNSMRASEKKHKSPSEYSNPYFRRGHPDLLWLIQKPKNVTGTASKRKGKADNDQLEEDADEFVEDVPSAPDTRVRARPGQLTPANNNSSALTQEQFGRVQRELAAIRNQQAQIARMMQQIKREHEQLYGQATTFQDQHNRHENSINAILTFLATVYNRSLQGQHEGMPSMASLFSNNAMPVDGASQANVVDVGDFSFDDVNLGASPGLGKPFKKQQLLLTNGMAQPGRATTVSPRSSAVNSPYPPRAQNLRHSHQTVLTPSVEEAFDMGVNTPSTTVPPQPSAYNQNFPQRDMMSVIQNANAHINQSASPTTPAQDFSNVLNNLEATTGNGPLSTSQRADVLKMINDSTQQPSGSDNALINSTPPSGPANFRRRLANTSSDLDNLAKMQAEQDKSVQNLTSLLQPLSPTGSIPGIGDGQSLPPPPLDIDDFLNHADYFPDMSSDPNGNYDFGNTGLDSNGANDFGFADYKDDDELFGNLPDPAAAMGFDAAGAGVGAGNPKFETASDFGGGHVESMPSSTVTTPKSASSGKQSEGPATRSKGRKMSAVDEDGGQQKRRRG
ncbi:heat shock transcription factor [Exophiala viscosa]|uniref:Heat shock transcription factor n=1 Tax=Exophiala viscosa TaxID=2486360 RepID=A0AAN6E274_9EURO|nr:heat shock transcription factor [Exophiala viscosa]